MPGGDRVGSAYVDIHVNAGPGEAELAAFKAKVDRDFDELGRKKAEATLNLKKVEFDREIDDAKTQLDYFKKRRATATLDLAKKHFDEQIAAAEAELKALTSKKRTIQIDSRQVKAAHDAERLLAKERALGERAALQSAKAERSLSTERERSITQTVKNRAALAKLSGEYEKLRGRQIGLEKSSRRVFSSRSLAVAESEARKLERVASEADYVKHKIEGLGGSVEHLDPQLQRNSGIIDRWLSRIGDTSLRIGPITTSFKGLAAGLGLLAPLVFELGGGITALAGTIGAGLAGAATVGAGALAGLATSAAGVGFVIGPMIGEFKEVTSAATSLHKAVLKYGKGSEQVKTAQERLNNELHGVSPIAREAFASYGGLKDRWKELTKAARPAVFNAFGQSLKTVQSLLPAFASESTKTTQVAAKAWDGWMKSLRSSEAKGLLKSIMSDFRASIPGLASGLGSLVAMMGRLSAAGAHFLPGLSNGFAEWANNLEHAVGGGQKLQSDVGGLVSQMRDLGHLTQDTGSLLVHIFSAGSHSGQGMVKSLDQVIKRWNTWTQSASGKAGLQEFFGDSKQATEDFMSSLSHLTKLLFEFSRATAPVANGLLHIVTWIGDIVSAADGLVGVKTIFQGIGLTLAGLFVASKVMNYSSAIAAVAARLGLMGAAAGEDVVATEALTVATTELTAALTATAAAATAADAALGAEGVLGAAAAADAGLGAGAAGATRAALGLDGAAESAGLLSMALAPEVLIPVGAVAGLAILATQVSGTKTRFEEAGEAVSKYSGEFKHGVSSFVADGTRYNSTLHEQSAATDKVAAARHRLIKLQNENAPMRQQTKAVEQLTDAEREQTKVSYEAANQRAKSVKDAKATLTAARERVKATKEQLALDPHNAPHAFAGSAAEAAEKNAQAQRQYATALREAGTAAREFVVANIPLERQQRGLKPITEQAQQALTELSKTIGTSATKKIGNLVDPKQVQQIANLGNHLTKLGQGSTVKNIAVKSQGADQTLNKLQAVNRASTRISGQTARLNVKTDDRGAQQKLVGLARLSQKVTGGRNTIHILANASNAEQAIARLRQHLENVAHKKYEATMSAIDRTQPGWQAAYHHLREVASKRYEARIDAIDNASAPAGKAKSAADRVKGTYQAHISAPGASQAANEIQGVINALAALHDKTVNVNVVTHKSGGFSGGPAGPYYSTFASGGISDREIQRANEKAVTRQSGPSRKITRPTMLVGEQAPSHPEYVIAMNPAFRADNERYLEQAAGGLGYTVVPAYKKGKGKKHPAAGGGNGPGPPPYKPQSHKHWSIHKHRFAPQSVSELNTAENQLSNEEGRFNAELRQEEQEIAHKKRSAWDFGTLKGFLNREEAIQNKIIHNLIPAIASASNKAYSQADKELKGPLSAKAVHAAQHEAADLAKTYSNINTPTKQKGESDKDYAARKKATEHHKKVAKANAKAAAEYAKRLAKERSDAQQMKEDARQELTEVRQEVRIEHETALKELQTETTNVGEIEQNPALAPYYEAAGGAGGTKPTPGEETATLSQAREELFNNFGSNIQGYFGSAPTGGPGLGGGGAALAAAGMSSGSPSYAAMDSGTSSSPTTTSTDTTSSGTVNNVTNYFAAPPPDPHIWVQTQQFELGALS